MWLLGLLGISVEPPKLRNHVFNTLELAFYTVSTEGAGPLSQNQHGQTKHWLYRRPVMFFQFHIIELSIILLPIST